MGTEVRLILSFWSNSVAWRGCDGFRCGLLSQPNLSTPVYAFGTRRRRYNCPESAPLGSPESCVRTCYISHDSRLDLSSRRPIRRRGPKIRGALDGCGHLFIVREVHALITPIARLGEVTR
ncbi:hypothetical protein F4803DRAFT_528903 [Xylaria telfairii]|nr:hypothetical protein F4803DRAFT_528903 [Xylaria telfairii]